MEKLSNTDKFLVFIMSFRGKRDIKGYVRISSNFLKGKFSQYQFLVRQLEEEGRLEVDRFYIPGVKAYGYKVVAPIKEQRRLLKKTSSPATEVTGIKHLDQLDKIDIDHGMKVIDVHTSIEAVRAKSTLLSINKEGGVMKGEQELDGTHYYVTYMNSGKTYTHKLEKLAEKVSNEDVWEYEGRLYCGDNFLRFKSDNLRANWIRHLMSWNNSNFYFKTSMVNRRSYDNTTSMPNPLMKLIKKGGDSLSSIDCVSSQPTLAAYLPNLLLHPFLIKYTSTSQPVPPIVRDEFKKAVDSGKLYEVIQGNLAEKGVTVSRGEAKRVFFTSIFSRSFDNEDAKLLESFDSGMKGQIDSFKQQFGYNHYAIALQLAESALWSAIKLKLEGMGIYNVGRHDSVYVTSDDVEATLRVIAEVYSNYIERFHLSVEWLSEDGDLQREIFDNQLNVA